MDIRVLNDPPCIFRSLDKLLLSLRVECRFWAVPAKSRLIIQRFGLKQKTNDYVIKRIYINDF